MSIFSKLDKGGKQTVELSIEDLSNEGVKGL